VTFIHQAVIFSVELSIDFCPMSLRPDSEEFLEDDLPETCASFSTNEQQRTTSITRFRFEILGKYVHNINITLFGYSLGCGYNLYLSPILENEMEKWTGRWKACQLVQFHQATTPNEICDYQCDCSDGYEKIQVLKAPRSLEESSWKLCHINITYQSFGTQTVVLFEGVRVCV